MSCSSLSGDGRSGSTVGIGVAWRCGRRNHGSSGSRGRVGPIRVGAGYGVGVGEGVGDGVGVRITLIRSGRRALSGRRCSGERDGRGCGDAEQAGEAGPHHPSPSIARRVASSITSTPSFSALASLLPASSPATT